MPAPIDISAEVDCPSDQRPQHRTTNDYCGSGEEFAGCFGSAYVLRNGITKVWIITEADRSATTALLPDEY